MRLAYGTLDAIGPELWRMEVRLAVELHPPGPGETRSSRLLRRMLSAFWQLGPDSISARSGATNDP